VTHSSTPDQSPDAGPETVESWLDSLASSSAAPGGGAAAALHAAMGAALVEMVCHLTSGRTRSDEDAELMATTLTTATGLRTTAWRLAGQDAEAFSRVVAAYRMPRVTPAEARDRTAAVQDALLVAAEVPLELLDVAADVVELCARILDVANPQVVSDVGVAAASAAAALEAGALNVAVNATSLHDHGARASLTARVAQHAAASERASHIVATVRERVSA